MSEEKRKYYRDYYERTKEHRKAYMKKWRAENPEKVREYNCRYWEKVNKSV
jgi:hypothetical protein